MKFFLLPCLIFVVATGALLAQQATGSPNEKRTVNSSVYQEKKDEVTKAKVQYASPFDRSNFSTIVSNVSLSSTINEKTTGKVDLKYNTPNLTYGFSASQLIGEASKEAVPVELEGLTDGATFEFNLQKMWWKPELTSQEFELFQAIKKKYAVLHDVDDPRLVTWMDIKKDSTLCGQLEAIRLRRPWFVNLSYSLTKSSYTYAVDSVDLTGIDQSYLSPRFKLAFIFPLWKEDKINGLFSLSYTYFTSYSPGDEITVLSPLGTTPNYLSQTITFGEPTKETDNRFNIEWRKRYRDAIGIAPSLTCGINSKKIAFSLPVYFIKTEENEQKLRGLQGGIRLSYETDMEELASWQDGFNVQLVIALPFDVLGDFRID